MRTTRHRRYSERAGGEVIVEVTPGFAAECDAQGKSAVFLRVICDGKTLWEPTHPICLSPLYDADSARGRREAADAAIDFFEHDAPVENPKAWDFDAVTYEGDVYCVGCLPDGVTVDDEGVYPVFASSEWDYYPVCGACGREHDYVGLTLHGQRDLERRRAIEPGSVSSGTMRVEHLVPVFLDELERVDEKSAAQVRREYADFLVRAFDDDAGMRRAAWDSDEAHFLLDALFEALNDVAPHGLFFGAHPGEGADYGWWSIDDE